MRIKTFAVVVLAVFLAGPVLADWDPSMDHKMHFPQLPDLDNGVNVLAREPKILADDWQCSESGWVTDIHIWGSWDNDKWPTWGLYADLYIFKDIPALLDPADNTTVLEHSRPGELVWRQSFPGVLSLNSKFWGDPEPEGFYDPNTNEIIGEDKFITQYNFYVPLDNAFRQEQGQVYWLGVQKRDFDFDNDLFGWKSSADNFLDDAVYLDLAPQGIPIPLHETLLGWEEMYNPHTGESMNLSFVITGVIPEPATVTLVMFSTGGLLALRRRRRQRR